jgi:hypothetical protein
MTTAEYQNLALFFQRTFITEVMRLLLDLVIKRLVGRGGDSVIQLQTVFGDGLQRAVKENCHTLRFKHAEFENPQG